MGFVAAVASVFPWLMSIGMIIGPVSPYVPQFLETRRTGIAGGFSPMVAFLLVVSSIGRVFYWCVGVPARALCVPLRAGPMDPPEKRCAVVWRPERCTDSREARWCGQDTAAVRQYAAVAGCDNDRGAARVVEAASHADGCLWAAVVAVGCVASCCCGGQPGAHLG